MKLVLLSAGDSHTAKWVRALTERGHDVRLLTMEMGENFTGCRVCLLPFEKPLGYYLNALALKYLLWRIKPDLLHVHYASGYGTLGRLAGYRPCILSVWGSDVFEFPYQSERNRKLIERNLTYYDHVCSTSNAMADQVMALCPDLRQPSVTPFGVDTSVFAPMPRQRSATFVTIGTVKSLEHYYGLDVLLKAFAKAQIAMDGKVELRLLLVGQGTLEAELMTLARELGIESSVEFAGAVPHAEVPACLNKIDIFANLSRAESFGVAVLEASACGVPVITTNVGGLPEVAVDNVTGKMVPAEDIDATSEAIVLLACDPDLREKLGAAGREFVKERYEWANCVDQMEAVYARVLSKDRKRIH